MGSAEYWMLLIVQWSLRGVTDCRQAHALQPPLCRRAKSRSSVDCRPSNWALRVDIPCPGSMFAFHLVRVSIKYLQGF